MPVSPVLHYGPRVSTQTAAAYLRRLFRQPAPAVPPVCLWGRHGIGKTELVRQLAEERDWALRVISPAQFEEMGDLIGLPYLSETDDGIALSSFAPPEWIPRAAGAGILLIDDFNRADERILRGLMALWQERRLSSWALPPDWYVILTGNPDNHHYSVTPVDEAMLSRMLHLEVIFELDSWIAWARSVALPERAIDFVRQHPELIDGGPTTARTLTFMFRLWQQAGEPTAGDPQLVLLAHSAVGPAAAEAFVRFLGPNASITLPDAVSFLRMDAHGQRTLLQQLTAGALPDPARLSDLNERLLSYLSQHPTLDAAAASGLERYLLAEQLPAEHRLLLLHGISAQGHPVLARLLAQPSLSRLILAE